MVTTETGKNSKMDADLEDTANGSANVHPAPTFFANRFWAWTESVCNSKQSIMICLDQIWQLCPHIPSFLSI